MMVRLTQRQLTYLRKLAQEELDVAGFDNERFLTGLVERLVMEEELEKSRAGRRRREKESGWILGMVER